MTREPLPPIGALFAHLPDSGPEYLARGREYCLRSIRRIVEGRGHEYDETLVVATTTTDPDLDGRVQTLYRYAPTEETR